MQQMDTYTAFALLFSYGLIVIFFADVVLFSLLTSSSQRLESVTSSHSRENVGYSSEDSTKRYQ